MKEKSLIFFPCILFDEKHCSVQQHFFLLDIFKAVLQTRSKTGLNIILYNICHVIKEGCMTMKVGR